MHKKQHYLKWLEMTSNVFSDHGFHFCQLKPTSPPPLTLGCKNKKQPFGPIELDLEAGNLIT